MKLSIIIPVYNEEKTLAQVIKAVKTAQIQADLTKEIVIINDGSTDRTASILKDFLHDPEIKVFNQDNKGKTAAVFTGIRNSTGDLILVQDADLEYAPDHYMDLLQPLLDKKCDIVFGSRFLGHIKGMTLINRLANLFSNFTFNVLHRSRLTDINTCFKLIPRSIMSSIDITSSGFTFETEITSKLLNRGHKLIEVPIKYKARTLEDGKKIKWKSACEMYLGIFKYLKAK